MILRSVALAPLAVALASCATPDYRAAHDLPDATPYIVSENPQDDVTAALERAAADDKRLLLVMGANWCHDSRALAGWLETPRFVQLLDEHYELVFVNVGMPQTGDGHNLGIAKQFGIDELPGTPNLLVVTGDGTLINPESATSWRNAASRSGDQIYAELLDLASRHPG